MSDGATPWHPRTWRNGHASAGRVSDRLDRLGRLTPGHRPRSSFMTAGGHVYPLQPYGLTIFHRRSVTNEAQKRTGFPGFARGSWPRGGVEVARTKKQYLVVIRRHLNGFFAYGLLVYPRRPDSREKRSWNSLRLIEMLSKPESYPHPVDAVDVRQTHISVVFLAGAFAYKLKKPVESRVPRLHHARQAPALLRGGGPAQPPAGPVGLPRRRADHRGRRASTATARRSTGRSRWNACPKGRRCSTGSSAARWMSRSWSRWRSGWPTSTPAPNAVRASPRSAASTSSPATPARTSPRPRR